MKKFPAWLTYTILRLLMIAVPLAVLLVFVPFRYWLFSVVAAVVIGLCLSYIFLKRPREAMSREVYEARTRGRQPAKGDDAVEDAVVDATSERVAGSEGRTVEQPDEPRQL